VSIATQLNSTELNSTQRRVEMSCVAINGPLHFVTLHARICLWVCVSKSVIYNAGACWLAVLCTVDFLVVVIVVVAAVI